MTKANELIDRYIAAWNETDAARRQELIRGAWTESARYLDPVMAGEGQAGIGAMIQGVQARFPGFRFQRLGEVDAHNDCLRFRWAAGPAGEATVIEGTDFALVEQDRLRSVTGFLDRVPGR